MSTWKYVSDVVLHAGDSNTFISSKMKAGVTVLLLRDSNLKNDLKLRDLCSSYLF